MASRRRGHFQRRQQRIVVAVARAVVSTAGGAVAADRGSDADFQDRHGVAGRRDRLARELTFGRVNHVGERRAEGIEPSTPDDERALAKDGGGLGDPAGGIEDDRVAHPPPQRPQTRPAGVRVRERRPAHFDHVNLDPIDRQPVKRAAEEILAAGALVESRVEEVDPERADRFLLKLRGRVAEVDVDQQVARRLRRARPGSGCPASRAARCRRGSCGRRRCRQRRRTASAGRASGRAGCSSSPYS